MKQETIIRPSGSSYYYVKTEAELEALRRDDIARGRTMTDDGETILYSKVGADRFEVDTAVTITKKRGVPWPTWSRKPAGLYEGLATIDGNPRLIMWVGRPRKPRGVR